MKLKKKTSLMMLMASTAAVVGVAAVSFAAWQGEHTAYTAQAAGGSVYLFGFNEAVTEPQTFAEKLVPYDQNAASVIEGQKVVVQTIPTYNVFEDYTITLSGATAGYTLYAYVGTANAEYDEKKETLNTTVNALPALAENGWQKLTASESAQYSFTVADDDKGEVKNMKIYLMLESDDAAQQGENFTFNVTLTTSSATPNA